MARLTLLLLALSLATLSANPRDADARTPATNALPTTAERLAHPVTLARCGGARIVEWKPTRTLEADTALSPEGVKVLEQTCRIAYERYGAFLR